MHWFVFPLRLLGFVIARLFYPLDVLMYGYGTVDYAAMWQWVITGEE